MNEKITKFIKNRPEVKAAFGYGSGVFKQSGYTKKDKPQIDLILVVDDLQKWHQENVKINKNDYSIIGKSFLTKAKINKLKGSTGITYLSNISVDGSEFKYGTIEYSDLLHYLKTWDSFYLPGRFQKTLYVIKEDKELSKAMEYNRDMAITLAAYLMNSDNASKKDIFVKLCGLSYLGDTRMKFAENPKKVENIVTGSYEEFTKIYDFKMPYFKVKKDNVEIDIKKLKKELKKLPDSLYKYIEKDLKEDNDEKIINRILDYFTKLNKKESTEQTLKGLSTNGIVRSIKYASKKVAKKIKK